MNLSTIYNNQTFYYLENKNSHEKRSGKRNLYKYNKILRILALSDG
jgi:hypothetical protein